jgi:hypothetical protein
MADWLEVVKVVGGAVGAVGLATVVIWDRLKASELKAKDAQLAAKDEHIKTLERQIKMLESVNSKTLMEYHEATKEGLEQALAQKDQMIAELKQVQESSLPAGNEEAVSLASIIERLSDDREGLSQQLTSMERELFHLKALVVRSGDTAEANAKA